MSDQAISTRMSAEIIAALRTRGYDSSEIECLLQVSPATLKLLAVGKRRLYASQLDRLAKETGRSWQEWVVAGSRSLCRDPQTVSFAKETEAMFEAFRGSSRSAVNRQRMPAKRSLAHVAAAVSTR